MIDKLIDGLTKDLELPEKKRKPGIIYLSSVPEVKFMLKFKIFFI